MKKMRRGFTLVEVSLFLAVTALVFVGVAIGTQNSIFQQRYNDAVQNFVEFLRTEYSRAENVQSDGDGNSAEYAVYGRLITFGQEKDLNGRDNENDTVFSYSVVAKIEKVGGDEGVLEQLRNAEFDVGIDDEDGFRLVGYTDSYTPRWGSQIQTTGGYALLRAAILIVRHPESGTIYTFVKDDGTLDINGAGDTGAKLAGANFKTEAINMCVNPNGAGQSNLRKDVQIAKNARNASGIEIMDGNGNCTK